MPKNPVGCRVEVIDGCVGLHRMGRRHSFDGSVRMTARTYQDRRASRTSAGGDIGRTVTDHVAAGQIEQKFLSGAMQQAGLWFAAGAPRTVRG